MQGGVGAYTQILARHLADLGHEIHLLTHTSAAEADSRIRLSGIVARWGWRSRATVKEWVNLSQLDVVHLQYQTAAYAMSPHIHFYPNLVRSVPFVTTFHDLRFPYLFPKAGPLRAWIVRRLARTSDGVIATNQEDAELLQNHPCLELIPIGSNIPAEPFTVQRHDNPEFTIAYFGFINRSKGVDLLLEALALARSQGERWRLNMIGGQTGSSDPTNASYLLEIESLIERYALGDSLTWSGFVSDTEVSLQLHEADVVALPFHDGASYRRGSLIAAIQHGCAILTTQPAVSVPAFVDEQNMLFCEQNADSVYAALKRLHRDPDLRSRLRAGASKLAPAFDWNTIATQTVAMYERVQR